MRAPAPYAVPRAVELFAVAAERFTVASAYSQHRAPIAACPGWSTHDLVVHLGNVHAWAATIVETGRRAAEQNDEPRSSRGKVVAAWYAGKAEDLFSVLREVDPARPCWNFAQGDGSVAFWSRRQLHETTMHLVDLDLACGRTPVVDPEVAVDGVSEVLEVLVHRMHARGHDPVLLDTLALTASDTGDTWVLTPSPGGVPEVRRGGSVDGVAEQVQAPAEMLYRLLWHRAVDHSAVRLSGDVDRVQTNVQTIESRYDVECAYFVDSIYEIKHIF